MAERLQIEWKRKFRTRVLLPGSLVLLITAMLFGGALITAGRGTDRVSLEAQKLEVWRELANGMDDLSLGQEALGLCTDCVANAAAAAANRPWLQENLGRRLHEMYGIDETYILDSGNRPVFASIAGDVASATVFARVAPSLSHYLDLARGKAKRPSGGSNLNERLPGAPSAPIDFPPIPGLSSEPIRVNPTVRTSVDVVHTTDLARIGSRVAIVSVMRMARAPNGDQVASLTAPLLVSIRYLDGSFLVEAAKKSFLLQPRLSDGVDPQAGETWTPIINSDRTPLTNLFWQPQLGGSAVVQNMLLPAGIMFGVVSILGLLMALALRHLMRKDDEQVSALHQAHRELKETLEELEKAHAELTAREAQAHHLAYHDVLTGLPNRALFNANADQALIRARHGEPAAIALLDLDRFKNVNDRFGHLAGDALIIEVGKRISNVLNRPNAVARLGGDEFAILFEGEDLENELDAKLQRILEDLQRPFDVVGNQAHIGASIGVAFAPRDGSDRGDLMRKADIALYRAKDDGRACYRIFTRFMDETVQLRAVLETELRAAIAKGTDLCVHYQPLIESSTGAIAGFEALLRWDHPTRGMIAPQLFVPVAEETGLIRSLGDWVIEEACQVAKEWPDLTISINLSPVQFCDDDFAERVCALVRAAGVSASQIEFEVTEGVVLDQSESVRGAVRRLRSEGFRIALDDFGTGYSSLSYLREFEVDRIKIDKSFVHGLGQTVDAAAIVTAVVTLGRAIGLQVTAEGVETADQESFLRSAGCNTLQGFFFSRAVPANQLHASVGTRPSEELAA